MIAMPKRPEGWVLQVSAVMRGTEPNPGWVPRVDLYEGPDELLLRVELPGAIHHGLSVHFNLARNSLSVKGERRAGLGLSNQGFVAHQIEIEDGPFAREIPLPALNMDIANTRSTWRDGVLELRIPIVRSAPGALVVETVTIKSYDE